MISRKKIILKSEDHLATGKPLKSGSKNSCSTSEEDFFNDAAASADYADENTWFSLEQLISDQISEIINKWSAIDDEIWGKVVCFERNRRIAKVYARSQVLSISGSECDFDGSRIGLNAFPNGRRDEETAAIKRQIKSGFKIKIDDLGNLYIKRVGKCAVYISTGEDCLQSSCSTAQPSAISKPNNSQQQNFPTKPVHFRSLEPNTPLTIFDMRAFLGAIADWSARHPAIRYPPADFLERFHQKCVHLIQVVVKEDGSLSGGSGSYGGNKRLLRHPCWIVLVNIVGLDLLWSRFGYSSMILLNQTQLVSLRSCFALGGPNEPGIRKKFNAKDSKDDSRRHPDSDDLYYSGYRAKISAHSAGAPTGVCSVNGNGKISKNSKLPSTKLPISPSSSLLLSRFAANRNDVLFSNNCGYQPNNYNNRNGNQFYYNNNNNNCYFNENRNFNDRNDLNCRSQIPRLIIGSKREFIRTGGNFRGPNSLLNSHHRRLARSSTHLHFTTSTSSTSNSNSTATSEDNCALTSSSSAEEFTYHPSKYNNSNNSGNGSGNPVCDSNGGGDGGGGGKKKFKSSNNKGNGNSQHRRIYTRHCHTGNGGREGSVDQCSSSRKLHLLNMRKLSSSNLELSSGTFYDLEEESSKSKRSADKNGILKIGKANSD